MISTTRPEKMALPHPLLKLGVKRALKVGFVGSRGIPARYGGHESFIEEITDRLVRMGFEVYVTCESNRFFQDRYNGVIRLHTPSIEGKSYSVPSVNDIIATLYLLLKHPHVKVIYYVSPDASLGAAIAKLFGKKVIINPDGMDFLRPALRRAYLSFGWKVLSVLASWYMKCMEVMAIRVSDIMVADSKAIKAHLERSHKANNVVYVPYGARVLIDSNIPVKDEREILNEFGLSAGDYYLTVSRIVAENNIHKDLEGFKRCDSSRKLAIVGNFDYKDGYTRYLLKLRDRDPRVIFLDAIYDKKILGILRKNCYAYIHAYQVGGTNPSLLEQMLFLKPIIAYDVPFSREVLQEGGLYFQDEDGLANAIGMLEAGKVELKTMAEWQARRIKKDYSWDDVTEKYGSLFRKLAG